MKYILALLVVLTLSITGYAEVVQEGNTFRIETTSDEMTPYLWQDKEGNIYPIYKTSKGSFYILKISKKTGKEYKYYLPKKVQEKIKRNSYEINR